MSSSAPKQIQAVIFDMDGLMLDSEIIYTEVTNSILKPYGKEFTWEIKSQLMGKPQHLSAALLVELTGIPLSPSEVIELMKDKLEAAFQIVRPLPGIERLVSHLACHAIPIAIATGSKGTNYDLKTAHLPHLFAHFKRGVNLIVGDDPVLEGRGKPDPKIFLEAGKLLGFVDEEQRGKVLVFEDAMLGVKAARSAGMEVVFVPDGELIKVMGDNHGLNPSEMLKSLVDFVPENWGLPPFATAT